MNVILFGATGMVGQGALRECLLDDGVEKVLSIGRSKTGRTHPKLRELVPPDLHDLRAVADELAGYDACFFCLGVSSAGMSEADYRRVTYDIAVSAARVLLEKNPGSTFVFVSGAGTDGTGRGGSMWARVKGETENAILAMPFRAAYMFRPAIIQPVHGARSRTALYRGVYTALWPLLPALRWAFPGFVTTSERVGRAMLIVVRRGSDKRILENRDINELAASE